MYMLVGDEGSIEGKYKGCPKPDPKNGVEGNLRWVGYVKL